MFIIPIFDEICDKIEHFSIRYVIINEKVLNRKQFDFFRKRSTLEAFLDILENLHIK